MKLENPLARKSKIQKTKQASKQTNTNPKFYSSEANVLH